MVKFTRTPENLNFIDDLRKALGDTNPKSFGLYVKLFKEFGQSGLAKALAISQERPAAYRLKYFLGILAKERESRKLRRRVRRSPEIKEGDSTTEQYLKLKEKLVRQMTPKYERISRERSRLAIKMAKEERKLKSKRREV